MPRPRWRGTASSFPLLLRTRGFHTGRHFVKVERIEALPETVAALPGADLIVIEYLDSRGVDGKVRKYRVMMIDGKLYPLHVAISSHWKIHYFTAEMAERAEHRAEDAEFLENMPAVLGPRAMAALAHDSNGARSRLCGHRFRLERGRRCAAIRGECHHGNSSSGARRTVGLPAFGVGASPLRGPPHVAGECRPPDILTVSARSFA